MEEVVEKKKRNRVSHKNSYIRFRCTIEEKEKVEELARSTGMTVTDYLIYMINRRYDKETVPVDFFVIWFDAEGRTLRCRYLNTYRVDYLGYTTMDIYLDMMKKAREIEDNEGLNGMTCKLYANDRPVSVDVKKGFARVNPSTLMDEFLNV